MCLYPRKFTQCEDFEHWITIEAALNCLLFPHSHACGFSGVFLRYLDTKMWKFNGWKLFIFLTKKNFFSVSAFKVFLYLGSFLNFLFYFLSILVILNKFLNVVTHKKELLLLLASYNVNKALVSLPRKKSLSFSSYRRQLLFLFSPSILPYISNAHWCEGSATKRKSF